MAGRFSDASWFAKLAMHHFQPFFEELLEGTARQEYEGEWVSKGENGQNKVTLAVANGSLWVTECFLNGGDLLEVYTGGSALSLWSTGRLHEFRRVVPLSYTIIDQLIHRISLQ